MGVFEPRFSWGQVTCDGGRALPKRQRNSIKKLGRGVKNLACTQDLGGERPGGKYIFSGSTLNIATEENQNGKKYCQAEIPVTLGKRRPTPSLRCGSKGKSQTQTAGADGNQYLILPLLPRERHNKPLESTKNIYKTHKRVVSGETASE